MNRRRSSPRPAALALALLLAATSVARADEAGWGDWGKHGHEVATAGVTYASFYTMVFVMVQALRVAIPAVAPVAYAGTAQMFGIPAVMVFAMSQLGPVLRSSVTPLVDGWFEEGQPPAAGVVSKSTCPSMGR